ncbi:MAG: hypothetical protein QXS54_06980 [Candidatus Methanomethylicaceae archaeon]
MSASRKFQVRARSLIQILRSRQAQNLEVSLLALLIIVFSVLLTFSDVFYLALSKYTSRPETLFFPLLVSLMWIIFQVAILERKSSEGGQMPQFLNSLRDAHIPEWILTRESMLQLFLTGNAHTKRWESVAAATPTLTEWILAAQPEVCIDILAFSAETFLPACLDAARAIAVQSPNPTIQQINIRILVRDTNAIWMIPYLPDLTADQQYRQELKTRFLQHQGNWVGLVLREFKKILPASKIGLAIRAYPFEPVFKGILINREIGLVGIYPLSTTSWRGIQVWDYMGYETPMIQISRTAESAFEQISFDIFLRWFDSLWNNFSRPWGAYS